MILFPIIDTSNSKLLVACAPKRVQFNRNNILRNHLLATLASSSSVDPAITRCVLSRPRWVDENLRFAKLFPIKSKKRYHQSPNRFRSEPSVCRKTPGHEPIQHPSRRKSPSHHEVNYFKTKTAYAKYILHGSTTRPQQLHHSSMGLPDARAEETHKLKQIESIQFKSTFANPTMGWLRNPSPTPPPSRPPSTS